LDLQAAWQAASLHRPEPATGMRQPQDSGYQPPVPNYPYPQATTFSLVQALGPTQPASDVFWAGLLLLLVGLVLTACSLLIGVTLFLGSGASLGSTLVWGPFGTSACFAIV